jgi:1,4-alpha-glucan branching enzyme
MALIFSNIQTVKGYHPDWKSLVFNYGRNEVRSFSNVTFFGCSTIMLMHRVDTVASMLYLDYSRKRGMGTQYMEEGEPGYHQFFKI